MHPTSTPTAAQETTPAVVRAALQELSDAFIIHPDDWEALLPDQQAAVLASPHPDAALRQLVDHGLLTEYQAGRLRLGQTFGLVLGNYRVLGHLGAGGMGVVFRAEHVRQRQPVAIKVLTLARDESGPALHRFLGEIQAVGQLRHPNIVAAFDSGTLASSVPEGPVLHYFVMEYVAGQDLEEMVVEHGPLPPGQASDIAWQVASALVAAHAQHLIHRDIKPSNVLVTSAGQAKLLDFGLTRRPDLRLTEPGTALGTLQYIAPEQAQDASTVDGRADVFGLGATLFWCLTGRPPFPTQGTIARDLLSRLRQPPPSVRTYQPHLPPELDDVVRRMMAVNPDDRYPTPIAVMAALEPFRVRPESTVTDRSTSD
jgi:serine/threonine protein kinase